VKRWPPPAPPSSRIAEGHAHFTPPPPGWDPLAVRRLLTMLALVPLFACGNGSTQEDEAQPAVPQRSSSASAGSSQTPAVEAQPAAAAPRDGDRTEDQARLAVGRNFSCALHQDQLYCWGDNRRGQLGVGSRQARSGPARVQGLEAVAIVAAGDSHACVATGAGGVACWGEAEEVGEGDASGSTAPTPIADLAQVVGLAAGGARTCARLRSGEVRCFGPDRVARPVTLPAAARAVGVGHSHACARLADGAMRCWGMNFFGQLGIADSRPADGPHEPTGVSSVVQIGIGNGHSCALRDGGEVWCWGDHRPDRRYDTTIALPQRRHEGVSRIVAGGLHTCMFSPDGSSRCREVFQERVWPSGARGRAHHPAMRVPEGSTEVALGEGHSCARLASGSIMCWGNNGFGESGAGDNYLGAPVEVAFPR